MEEATNFQRTWSVIQFLEDGSVEAVPSIWIRGSICYWPSLPQARLTSAIKKLEPLNMSWQTHKIKVFENGIFDDYIKARAKAKTAEDTSDLQSEAEHSAKRRRKQQKTLVSTSDDDDSLLGLPSPPNPPNRREIDLDYIEEREEEIVNTIDRHESGTINNSVLGNESENIEIAASSCSNCAQTKKNINSLVQQMHLIRGILTDVLWEVKNMKTKMSNSSHEKTKSFFERHKDKLNFPLNTLEEMELLESILGNEEDFKDALKELSKLGGKNNYNFITRALSTLITNNIALQYSWLGRKDKKDFHMLKIAKLVLHAAEVAKLADNTRQSEISIQLWLRRACDRKSIIKKF